MKYQTNDVRLIGRGPAAKRRRRERDLEQADHCRPFQDKNYFGICSDCGREEKLRASASNLLCAAPVCGYCHDLCDNYCESPWNVALIDQARNNRFRRWAYEKFGIWMTRDLAHKLHRARVEYNKQVEAMWIKISSESQVA